MRKQLLLGFNKDGEVVFGNVEYRDGRFTASFETSYPMEIGDKEAMESIESYIDNMEKEWVLDKLEYYDCKPSELAEKIYNDSYDVVGDFFDNSLYTESFRIDGVKDDIYFISSSCGQHDTRYEMETFINKDLYDAIHKLWDEYHLKEVPFEKVEGVFEAIEQQNNTIDDYKVIENWLINGNLI